MNLKLNSYQALKLKKWLSRVASIISYVLGILINTSTFDLGPIENKFTDVFYDDLPGVSIKRKINLCIDVLPIPNLYIDLVELK